MVKRFEGKNPEMAREWNLRQNPFDVGVSRRVELIIASSPYPSTSSTTTTTNPLTTNSTTTSTALLSRSNSSGFNTNAARNHYVPLSPSPTRTRSDANGTRHRATKSRYIPDSSPTHAPRPLPTPPPFPTSISDEFSIDGIAAPRRSRRADTLPTAPAPFDSGAVTVSIVDLPSNPKLWTPIELASYLMTALRVTSQNKSQDAIEVALPARVAKDIASFVRSMRITGRTFLRLNEDDLSMMGVNQKWRSALLAASRNLRQNVLKGRIWGSDLDPELEDVISPISSTSSSPSRPLPTPPVFSNGGYNSSSSSVDLDGENDVDAGQRSRRHRNGRVRGMVATFERSGSFSSDAGSIDEGRPEPSVLEEWRAEAKRHEQDDDAFFISDRSSPGPASPLADTTFTADTTVVDLDDKPGKVLATEEPTIEELLASEPIHNPKRGSWGARAWEEIDSTQGVTVKHIPTDESVNGIETIVASGSGRGSGKSSGRGTRGRGRTKDERRIVTAIFTPSAPSTLPEAVQDVFPEPEKPVPQEAPVQPDIPAQQPAEEFTPLELTLMSELAETRALIETFRSRLENVETKMAALEAKAHEEPPAHPPPTADALEIIPRTEPDAPEPDSSITAELLAKASSLITPNARKTRGDDDDVSRREPSVSDIPSYVLLVGIGVVLKKLIPSFVLRLGTSLPASSSPMSRSLIPAPPAHTSHELVTTRPRPSIYDLAMTRHDLALC
ncbi:hypothetical protein BXZ70DRAFT_908904 [Cristinia sonorae]|uniref:Uncharacterized protein n=1 Tax=Cristinia sonorae TaxID=1940300 RepID=A0A8K0ULA9_9AGAR|nr:hypothetical protein BXZ70DRAFT_908904 [Cristinia sonorae]